MFPKYHQPVVRLYMLKEEKTPIIMQYWFLPSVKPFQQDVICMSYYQWSPPSVIEVSSCLSSYSSSPFFLLVCHLLPF